MVWMAEYVTACCMATAAATSKHRAVQHPPVPGANTKDRNVAAARKKHRDYLGVAPIARGKHAHGAHLSFEGSVHTSLPYCGLA